MARQRLAILLVLMLQSSCQESSGLLEVESEVSLSTAAASELLARGWAAGVATEDGFLIAGGGVCSEVGCSVAFGQGETAATELFDPETDQVVTASDMLFPRWGHALHRVGRVAFSIGGTSGNRSRPIAEVEQYDLSTGEWTTVGASMPTPRWKLASALWDSRIYTFGGGATGNQCAGSASVETYDPSAHSWAAGESMPTPRWGASAATAVGGIYVMGGAVGCVGGFIPGQAAEHYDPSTDAWTPVEDMPTARWDAAAASANGKIYVLGGYDGISVLNTLEEYEPLTGKWSARAPMPTPRTGLVLLERGGLLYAMGGHNGTNLTNTVEIYDPTANSWNEASAGEPASSPCATFLGRLIQGKACETLKQLRSESYFGIGESDISDAALLEYLKANKKELEALLAQIDYGREVGDFLEGDIDWLEGEKDFVNSLGAAKTLGDILNPVIQLLGLFNESTALTVTGQSWNVLSSVVGGMQVFRNAKIKFTVLDRRNILRAYVDNRADPLTGESRLDSVSAWNEIMTVWGTLLPRLSEAQKIPLDELPIWFENAFIAYRLVGYTDSEMVRHAQGRALAMLAAET